MSSAGRGTPPGLREWCAEAEFPWPPVDAMEDGAVLVACFCVAEFSVGQTRSDRAFLRLRLSDRNGELQARVWEDAERIAKGLETGSYVGVRGRLETYRGQRQLMVDRIAPVRVDPEELGLFLPRSSRDQKEMEAELEALIDSIEDRALRQVVDRLLDPDRPTGRAFRQSPAAKRLHHACVGGLLEHTLSVAGACDALATHYGGEVDRSLLISGALLHDLGKTRELSTEGGFPYTDEGKLLGHIVLGMQMIEDAAREVGELSDSRRALLLHLVASHQGRYEWQSPREPLTVEAVILHHADNLDAKLTQVFGALEDVEEGWSSYDRSLGREFLRHRSGGDDENDEGKGSEEERRAGIEVAAERGRDAARSGGERNEEDSGAASGGMVRESEAASYDLFGS